MTIPDTPNSRSRSRLIDLCMIGLLLGLTLKMTYEAWTVRDLRLDDESVYLRSGTGLAENGFPSANYSPLYSGWYYLWSQVISDYALLYYFNWAMLAFLLATMLYVLIRCLNGPRIIALLAAFFLLTSRMVDISPQPMHLATVVLAAGLALMLQCRSRPWAVALLGISFLLASYVRPEFGLGFVFFALATGIVTVYLFVRRRLDLRDVILPASLVVLLATVLAMQFGSPLASGRSIIAFGQHYALNVVENNKSGVNPWYNWEQFLRNDFGNANSPSEAFINNPQAFFWHVWRNVRSFPSQFLFVVRPQLDLIKIAQQVLVGLIGAIAVLGCIGFYRRLRQIPHKDDRRQPMVLFTLGSLLVLASASITTVLIYPRHHYLVPGTFVALVLLASGLTYLPRLGPVVQRLEVKPVWLTLGALLMVVTPNRAYGWDAQRLIGWHDYQVRSTSTENLKTCALMRELSIEEQVRVMDCDFPYAFFAGMSYQSVRPITQPGDGLQTFLHKKNVDVLVLRPTLRELFPKDPELEAILQGRPMTGYTMLRVGDSSYRIAVRNDRLQSRRVAEVTHER